MNRLTPSGNLVLLGWLMATASVVNAGPFDPFTTADGTYCQYGYRGTMFLRGDPNAVPPIPDVPDHLIEGWDCEDPINPIDPVPEGNAGPPEPGEGCAGNPITFSRGNKYQHEVDFQGRGTAPLTVERYYNSIEITDPVVEDAVYTGRLGGQWRHNYEATVVIRDTTNPDVHEAQVVSPQGRVATYYGEADGTSSVTGVLEWDANGARAGSGRLFVTYDSSGNYTEFKLDMNGLESIFDDQGRLTSMEVNRGFFLTLDYDSMGRLDTVDNPFGDSLEFDYASTAADSSISSITMPDNRVVSYSQDSSGNLWKVTQPDDPAPATTVKEYHYENTSFPHALTGVTDEVNERYNTWEYDSSGRANLSKHHGDTDKVTIDYTYVDDATDPRVTVTNPHNKDTIYHFVDIGGVRKVESVEGLASANCVAANQNYEYDANGFITKITDWEGNVTEYKPNAYGYEEERTEAKGTSVERTTLTYWDKALRKPYKIDEPERITEFVHDSEGRVTQLIVQTKP